MAFPRLNAPAYWIFLFGGIFLYSAFIFSVTPAAGAPGMPGNLDPIDAGTFGALPTAAGSGISQTPGPTSQPGTAMDFGALGLQILGLASLISAVNFITTILNLRARGMRLLRMPVFVWMTMIVAFLLLFSLPIIAMALFMVTADRQFGTLFFQRRRR